MKTLTALLIAVASLSLADSANAQTSQWSGTCHVTFGGKSTLHDFEGTVDSEPFIVTITGIDNPANAKASSVVTVKADNMDTDNDKRDTEMYKTLDTTTYPEIKVSIADLTAAATKPKTGGTFPQPTVIPFTLDIKGKTLPLTGSVSDWTYAEDKISFTVSFPVSLKDADIKPPSVLGLIKVKDEITVQGKLSLTRK